MGAQIVVVQFYEKPIAKSRPRMARNGCIYTPEKTRQWERRFKLHAQEAMNGESPVKSPVAVEIELYFQPPKHWPAWRRNAAILGHLVPAAPPDVDNCAKIILDSMNSIVYHDDSQVSELRIKKRFAESAMVRVAVSTPTELHPLVTRAQYDFLCSSLQSMSV